jgi:hypothetical protein
MVGSFHTDGAVMLYRAGARNSSAHHESTGCGNKLTKSDSYRREGELTHGVPPWRLLLFPKLDKTAGARTENKNSLSRRAGGPSIKKSS